MTRRQLTVVLVDDHADMRTALRTILEADDITVVGEAADGEQAIGVVRATRPDVVVMDLRMPRADGISTTSRLSQCAPEAAVLVLTTFDDDASLFGALAAGAAGFMLKNAPPEELQRAVRRVADGDAVLDPEVTSRVVRRAVPISDDGADITRLTERERDVLWLIARARTNAEIAATLGMGDATAKTHVSSIISKLGVRDRVHAAIRAHELGFAQTDRVVARSTR